MIGIGRKIVGPALKRTVEKVINKNLLLQHPCPCKASREYFKHTYKSKQGITSHLPLQGPFLSIFDLAADDADYPA